MPLKTAIYTIDQDHLPAQIPELGVQFVRENVAMVRVDHPPKDMVLLKPSTKLSSAKDAIGPEPKYYTVLCNLNLQTPDGKVAQGQGQLLITAQRVVGMIEKGALTGNPPLLLKGSGKVYCFTFFRNDVDGLELEKHPITLSKFLFTSKKELEVPFQLSISSAEVSVINNKMAPWHDKHMLDAFSDPGRQVLLD